MEYTYKTSGVCSREINIKIGDDGKIADVKFFGGCNGNLQGISKLVIGQKPGDVIEKLSGIRCGFKPTSCPDQLAEALQSYVEKH